jgi:hypothetical protein
MVPPIFIVSHFKSKCSSEVHLRRAATPYAYHGTIHLPLALAMFFAGSCISSYVDAQYSRPDRQHLDQATLHWGDLGSW